MKGVCPQCGAEFRPWGYRPHPRLGLWARLNSSTNVPMVYMCPNCGVSLHKTRSRVERTADLIGTLFLLAAASHGILGDLGAITSHSKTLGYALYAVSISAFAVAIFVMSGTQNYVSASDATASNTSVHG